MIIYKSWTWLSREKKTLPPLPTRFRLLDRCPPFSISQTAPKTSFQFVFNNSLAQLEYNEYQQVDIESSHLCGQQRSSPYESERSSAPKIWSQKKKIDKHRRAQKVKQTHFTGYGRCPKRKIPPIRINNEIRAFLEFVKRTYNNDMVIIMRINIRLWTGH